MDGEGVRSEASGRALQELDASQCFLDKAKDDDKLARHKRCVTLRLGYERFMWLQVWMDPAVKVGNDNNRESNSLSGVEVALDLTMYYDRQS